MSTAISFQKICKNYGAKMAIKDLSFQVERGEFIAFVGPNGAGKSTTMSLILGQRSPSSGSLQVLGGNAKDNKVRARIGATPQDLDFPVDLKCREIVHWISAHFAKENSNTVRIDSLKEQLLLTPFWNQETGGLSGGEKRRLGLMLALLPDPDLLVLDEPTTGMDVNSRRMMWDVIRQCQSQGKTILMTTHYLDEVEELCDRVLVVDQGTLLFSGSVELIKKRVDYKMIEVSVVDDSLKGRPGIFNWNFKDQRAQFMVKDADAFIRELVRSEAAFTDLHVRPARLEDAFLALRKEL